MELVARREVISRTYTSYYIKRPLKLVYKILLCILEVFNIFYEFKSFRIVGLKGQLIPYN